MATVITTQPKTLSLIDPERNTQQNNLIVQSVENESNKSVENDKENIELLVAGEVNDEMVHLYDAEHEEEKRRLKEENEKQKQQSQDGVTDPMQGCCCVVLDDEDPCFLVYCISSCFRSIFICTDSCFNSCANCINSCCDSQDNVVDGQNSHNDSNCGCCDYSCSDCDCGDCDCGDCDCGGCDCDDCNCTDCADCCLCLGSI